MGAEPGWAPFPRDTNFCKVPTLAPPSGSICVILGSLNQTPSFPYPLPQSFSALTSPSVQGQLRVTPSNTSTSFPHPDPKPLPHIPGLNPVPEQNAPHHQPFSSPPPSAPLSGSHLYGTAPSYEGRGYLLGHLSSDDSGRWPPRQIKDPGIQGPPVSALRDSGVPY